MSIVLAVAGFTLIMFSLYIGKKHLDFYQRGFYNSLWSPTIGRINKALQQTVSADARRELIGFKRVYKVYFTFFIAYAVLVFAYMAYSIVIN